MAKKRNKVSFSPSLPNMVNVDSKPDMGLLKKAAEKVQVVEKAVKPAILISRANYPIQLQYGDECIILSPREKAKILDLNKLETKDMDPQIIIKKL